MPSEQSDQTKAFCKQWVEGTDCILLAASRKMVNERNKLRDGLLSKKDPGPDCFENSQLLQMQMMLKIRNCFQAKIKSRALFDKAWSKDEMRS